MDLSKFREELRARLEGQYNAARKSMGLQEDDFELAEDSSKVASISKQLQSLQKKRNRIDDQIAKVQSELNVAQAELAGSGNEDPLIQQNPEQPQEKPLNADIDYSLEEEIHPQTDIVLSSGISIYLEDPIKFKAQIFHMARNMGFLPYLKREIWIPYTQALKNGEMTKYDLTDALKNAFRVALEGGVDRMTDDIDYSLEEGDEDISAQQGKNLLKFATADKIAAAIMNMDEMELADFIENGLKQAGVQVIADNLETAGGGEPVEAEPEADVAMPGGPETLGTPEGETGGQEGNMKLSDL